MIITDSGAGVLRTAVRQRASGDLFQPPDGIEAGSATSEEIATWFSHPTWMVAKWLKLYGPASTVALLKHNNRCSTTPMRACAQWVSHQSCPKRGFLLVAAC